MLKLKIAGEVTKQRDPVANERRYTGHDQFIDKIFDEKTLYHFAAVDIDRSIARAASSFKSSFGSCPEIETLSTKLWRNFFQTPAKHNDRQIVRPMPGNSSPFQTVPRPNDHYIDTGDEFLVCVDRVLVRIF